MLKVLHYIPGFLYGGIESLYLSWYKHIDTSEVQFELLLRTQDDNCAGLKELRSIGGKYYRVSPLSLHNLGLFKKSIDEFFQVHHDYDILHAHETDPFVLASARKHGIKTIVAHSHSASRDQGLKSYLHFLENKLSLLCYADYAFACSKLAADYRYGSMKFKGNDVIIIHNAIDADKYDYDPVKRDSVRTKEAWKNCYVIGHVGRLTYPKNQFFLLDIFSSLHRRIPHAILVIVGDGPDREALIEYADKLGLRDCVVFMGAREDVADLLQGMDCFLLPSRYEGLPVTLIEAQAAGLPCVISDVITQEADVTQLVYRMSLSDDPTKWALKIWNTKDIRRMSMRKNVILSGFDMKNGTAELVKKYKEMIIKQSL